MSHTVTVRVELSDQSSLRAAVVALGGQWLGQGSHHLYQGDMAGLGLRLPGWRYPVVVQASRMGACTLAYDDYRGAWGRVSDLDRLREQYTIELARRKCEALGWPCERQGDGLIVYHPSGGTLTITTAGEVDAAGFSGGACADAIRGLSLGEWQSARAKPEYHAVAAHVGAAKQQ